MSLAAVLLAAVGLSVYRVNQPEALHTYRAHGVSFEYPAAWRIMSYQTYAIGGGAQQLWQTAVGPGTKLDMITVAAYHMKISVTAENIDAVIPEIESTGRQFFEEQGGSVEAGPEKIGIAGSVAVRLRGTGTIDGSPFESTMVAAFSGTIQYFPNCQHTEAKAEAVERACDQLVCSFTITGGANAAGPTPTPTPTTETPKSPATSAPNSPPANTAQTMKIGQTTTIPMDSAAAADLTIVSVKVSTRPADEFGSAPQRGYFLTVQVRARALATSSTEFDINAMDFYALVRGEHFEEGTGNALDAPGADRELGARPNAGESTSGTLVFDVPTQHGKIAYSPAEADGPVPPGRSNVAYWTF